MSSLESRIAAAIWRDRATREPSGSNGPYAQDMAAARAVVAELGLTQEKVDCTCVRVVGEHVGACSASV